MITQIITLSGFGNKKSLGTARARLRTIRGRATVGTEAPLQPGLPLHLKKLHDGNRNSQRLNALLYAVSLGAEFISNAYLGRSGAWYVLKVCEN